MPPSWIGPNVVDQTHCIVIPSCKKKKMITFSLVGAAINNDSQRMMMDLAVDGNKLDECEIWMRIVDFGLVIVMVMVWGHKITKATQAFLSKTQALEFLWYNLYLDHGTIGWVLVV